MSSIATYTRVLSTAKFGTRSFERPFHFLLFSLALSLLATYGFSVGLDPTFGTGGKFTLAFAEGGTPASIAKKIFVQPSGRILLVGPHVQDGKYGRTSGIAIAGLTSGGLLDPTYGAIGKVLIWDPLFGNELFGSLMNPNGSLLLLTRVPQPKSTYSLKLVRYTTDGEPDLGFAADLDYYGIDAVSLLLSPGRSGKIYLLIQSTLTSSFYLVRLNPDGSRDTSFGPAGVRNLNLSRLQSTTISGLHELENGKILLTGSYVGPGLSPELNLQLFAARFDSEANLDHAFGLQGITKIRVSLSLGGPTITGYTQPVTSIIQPDGKILISGRFVFLGSFAVLVRLTPRGRIDYGFGTSGMSFLTISGGSVIQSMAFTPDGKFSVAGIVDRGDVLPLNPKLFVGRYSGNGLLESSMVINFSTDFDSGGYGITFQPDGKILTAGFSRNPSGTIYPGNIYQFAAARFLP